MVQYEGPFEIVTGRWMAKGIVYVGRMPIAVQRWSPPKELPRSLPAWAGVVYIGMRNGQGRKTFTEIVQEQLDEIEAKRAVQEKERMAKEKLDKEYTAQLNREAEKQAVREEKEKIQLEQDSIPEEARGPSDTLVAYRHIHAETHTFTCTLTGAFLHSICTRPPLTLCCHQHLQSGTPRSCSKWGRQWKS
jgi:hypothetical protein